MVQLDTVFAWTKVDCTADKIFLSKHSVYSITKSLATFLKIIFKQWKAGERYKVLPRG